MTDDVIGESVSREQQFAGGPVSREEQFAGGPVSREEQFAGGPGSREEQFAELQARRRAAMDGHSGLLRQIERDLHDGPQVHLANIVMLLGRAEERLNHGGDIRDLIAGARAGAREALDELRALARGVGPVMLDLGLVAALETRIAQCALPVELDVQLTQSLSPAVEDVAFYCVSELLTNVVKHAAASRIQVSIQPAILDSIVIRVRDDGCGGAPHTSDSPPSGTGLPGLRWRVRSVDGMITVDSPSGRGTTVTITLPCQGPR